MSGLRAEQAKLFEPARPLDCSGFETETVELSLDSPIWERVFTVAPLVLVGTKEPDGSYDLAPKHMAMPLGWGNRFCFVCTPGHATHANARREGAFTVSVSSSGSSTGSTTRSSW